MVKKKILYFIQLPPPSYGQALASQRIFESDIVNGNIEKELIRLTFSKKLTQLRKFNFFKVFQLFNLTFQLVRKIITFRPDYIFFTISPRGLAFFRDLLFVAIMKFFRIDIIFRLHRIGLAERAKNKMIKILYQFAFNNCVVIHGSNGLLEKEVKPLGLKNAKLFPLENGIPDVDISKYDDHKDQDGLINILFISNLSLSKGIIILLKAIHIVSKKHPNFILHLIGASRGKDVDAIIQKNIKQYNLQEKVIFHGSKFDDEKYALLSKADIFVHPTLDDSFPGVILDGLQFGKAIISTDLGAIPEMIEHETSGLVIPVNDQMALVEKIEYLIENEHFRRELGKNARKKYEENYTLTNYLNRTKNLFDSL